MGCATLRATMSTWRRKTTYRERETHKAVVKIVRKKGRTSMFGESRKRQTKTRLPAVPGESTVRKQQTHHAQRIQRRMGRIKGGMGARRTQTLPLSAEYLLNVRDRSRDVDRLRTTGKEHQSLSCCVQDLLHARYNPCHVGGDQWVRWVQH